MSNLSTTIGEELTCCANYTMSDLDSSLRQYIDKFRQEDENGFRKEVDFEPVMKGVQKLTNTTSLIVDTTLNKCELATLDVVDALTVLKFDFKPSIDLRLRYQRI